MSDYFILTSSGSRGPFAAAVIQRGVADGSIPPNAQLTDARTGASVRAGDVRADALAAPADSGPAAAPPSAPAWPQYQAAPAPQPAPQQTYPYPQAPYPQPPGPQYPQPGYAPRPYGSGQTYGQAYHPGGYQPARPTSGLAIASLVLSLSTFATCLPLWIGGIICGTMALKECAPWGPKEGRGLAQGGLYSGIVIGVLYVPVVLLWIAAVAADL
ncbi:MAG: DUF4190 domain-containing protein [Planctomycetes bacterium]|jgi:hypothetical protein|nr:DUF4190 domain-containing protein [Planctomycetota bacterium]